jgi:hypothetical protein
VVYGFFCVEDAVSAVVGRPGFCVEDAVSAVFGRTSSPLRLAGAGCAKRISLACETMGDELGYGSVLVRSVSRTVASMRFRNARLPKATVRTVVYDAELSASALEVGVRLWMTSAEAKARQAPMRKPTLAR